jgi:uncharacterized protein
LTINTRSKRGDRIWVGIFSLLGLGFAVLLLNTASPAMTFSVFTTRFLGIFIEAVPFLLMGVFVSGLLEVYVTREDIVRWIPKNRAGSTLAGAFMGFAFPVCECGVVPVTRRLFSKGLPMSVGVAFLLAAPVMNPIVLVSTIVAFTGQPDQWLLVGLRFGITIVVAVGGAALFALAARPHETLRPVSLASIGGGSGAAPPQRPERPSFVDGFSQAMRVGANDFFEMGRFLVVGSLLAAGLQTFVSQPDLLALGEGPLVSVLVMQLLAFVLSICSTVDAFVALPFVNTFTTGSITAFLTFGPMVDIKSMLMYAGVFKPRVVAYMVLLPLLMTMLIGLWINLFL